MTTVYEYCQHRATAQVWAVRLEDGRLTGAVQLGPRDVEEDLLPFLVYQIYDLEILDKRRGDFTKIDGRRFA